MSKKEIFTCDIDGCKNHASDIEYQLQVIFHTDQTEGRSCKPYHCNVILDICESCKEKSLQGYPVHANGAQGNNTYQMTDLSAMLLEGYTIGYDIAQRVHSNEVVPSPDLVAIKKKYNI